MKKILIIGGTGIIGKQTIKAALENGYDVTTIALKKDLAIPDSVNQVICDKNKQENFKRAVGPLIKVKWDIVFDVYNLGLDDAKRTYSYFKDCAGHIFIISTTLVYDRSKFFNNPITSDSPLAKTGSLGGYVDQKLALEKFWRSIHDVPWTILRPYHIVGAGCLLGCIPDENRDPKLLERIKNRDTLILCEGGNVKFNYVHPMDIAKIVFKAAGNSKTIGKSYNAVNPISIMAKEYYEHIGELLNTPVTISSKSIKDIWHESRGWELTTLPHIYDTSDLLADVGYVPNTPLKVALKEAVAHYPNGEKEKAEISIHKRMTILPRPQPISWL